MTPLLPTQEQLLKNAAKLRSIYVADIPENAYQKMEEDIRNDRLPIPQIVINDKMKEDYGVKSTYDNATGVISLAQYAVDPSSADQKGPQRLVSEEFGHHLDNLLRTLPFSLLQSSRGGATRNARDGSNT